jgi:hypothetical protein
MTEEPNLKTALTTWAEQNNVRPSAFARAMGYTPSYGWSLLRGQADMTPEAFGRFVLAYGTDAAEQVMQMAGLRTENLPCSNGTQTLPTFPKG